MSADFLGLPTQGLVDSDSDLAQVAHKKGETKVARSTDFPFQVKLVREVCYDDVSELARILS